MGENIKSNLDVINVRGLPIGNSDFQDMIKHNDLFVDKSMIIAELLKDRPKVHLFTRPRRFGKTTTLMMLKEFFDIGKKEENKNLFNNLAISNTKYMEDYQGKHPVIFVSFKDIKYRTTKESFSLVKGAIRMMYDSHKYLLNSLNKKEKEKFEKILNEENSGDYEKSILNLSKYLYEYWGKKVVILIDEYDTPLITSYIYDYYEEVVPFYRVMYGLAFKDNIYLEKAVITGINRIAKEGMFSGLNNLKVNTIFSKEYENYFGFTEKEIKELLKEYKLENEFENVKKWYDGYKINGMSIYNTWSIINYLYHKEFGIYWVNTGDNGEITKFLGDITKKTEGIKIFKELEKLAKGETIEVSVTESVLFKDLSKKNELWNLMLNAGYLTSLGETKFGIYNVKIPNYEIQKFFTDAFIQNFVTEYLDFVLVLKAILNGNMKIFEEELKNYILTSSSFMISDKEIFYQGFMLGMFIMLKEYYIANIELEAGKGRADMILEAFNKNDMSYIIEMKVAKSKEEIEKISKKALTQIKEKKYYSYLIGKKIKNITIIGLTFFEKEVVFNYEKI